MLLVAGIALMSIAAVTMIWLSGHSHGSGEARAVPRRSVVRNLMTQKRFLEVALRDTRRSLEDTTRALQLSQQQFVGERRRSMANDSFLSVEAEEPLFDLTVPPEIFSIYSGDIPTPIPMMRAELDEFASERVAPIHAVVGHFSHRAFSQIGLGVLVADSDGKVAYINPVLQLMTGWTPERALHQAVDDVLRTTRESVSTVAGLPMLEQLGQEDSSRTYMQLVLHHRAGHRLEIKRAAFAARDQHGQRIGRVILVRDKSERRLMTLKIASQIQHDPITSLLNRQSFNTYLERAVEERRRLDQPKVFLYLDIDHFKVVNDACGFEAGDALLQWVAAALRETARAHDVVARLGGDEFGVLLSSATPGDAERMARDVQSRLRAFSFTWDDKTIDVTLSIALVPVTAFFDEIDKLLGVADQLCVIAKDNGGNQVQLYRADDSEIARRRADMMQATLVKGNLKDGRFRLWAQPIQALNPEAQEGLRFEVLLRCLDPQDQLLPPVDVIRAAERYGGMVRLDRWVIKKTFETLAASPELLERVEMCSINLSGASFKNASLLEFVHEQFRTYAVSPQKICFELTETAAVENLGRALRVIDGLCTLGCQFALDDFGSGLASYGYIKDLPITHLKIDGSFVRDMGKHTLNRAIVESINQIGHFLGIKTTAEAVTSRKVEEELRILGVDYAQGYWIGRPAPLADILGVPVICGDRPSFIPAPPDADLEQDFEAMPTMKLRPVQRLLPES